MKQLFFNIIFLFIFYPSYSQKAKSHEFIGTLQLEGENMITFKVSFNVDLTGKIIDGVSVSDIYGNDRTSTVIKGTYDTIAGKISFYEVKNISTRAKSEPGDFCYIQVNNARIKREKGKVMIIGSFKGKLPNGKSCGSGKIYLMNKDFLFKVGEKFMQSERFKKMDSTNAQREKINDYKEKNEVFKLTVGEELLLDWEGQELTIELWDGGNEDNDEIELYVNNKKVLDRLIINRNKKTLVVQLQPGVNVIKVLAMNEGTEKPCTANIAIINGEGVEPTYLRTKLKVGEQAFIKLNVNNPK